MAGRSDRRGHAERGAALVTAISLLFLFSLMGTAYLKHMSLENDAASQTLRETRARQLAAAGVEAAIGALRAAETPEAFAALMSGPVTFGFETYGLEWTGSGHALTAAQHRRAEAVVSISDESGKININHAPAPMLERALNVDRAAAEAIVAETKAGRWFTSVDELAARGLLPAERVDASILTVDTVADHGQARGYLNVNTAPVRVLAAIFAVTEEEAEKIRVKGPFQSMEALREAVGKDPGTYTVTPDLSAPDALPPALSFDARCHRILSEGVFAHRAGQQEYQRTRARVEAVVRFDDGGGHEIMRWAAQRGAA